MVPDFLPLSETEETPSRGRCAAMGPGEKRMLVMTVKRVRSVGV